MSARNYQRIMVIRLGALGDMILCAPAFQAIRTAHPRAIITLLTQPAWVGLAEAMPWFDNVITDTRAAPWQLGSWWDLRRRVGAAEPQAVFDLQGKSRQAVLYWLFGGPWGEADWCGNAWRCRYPRVWPPQDGWHFTDFIRAQLDVAGVAWPMQPDYDWLTAPVDGFNLPKNYVLLIPGCAPSRPEKRWPHYAQLAQQLQAAGLDVVMVGTAAEAAVLADIKAAAPVVINLGGQTSLLQLGALARGARAAVGNDTGPSHIAAAVGAPTLTLFAGSVNPVWSAPRGAQAQWLQAKQLSDLTVESVLRTLQPMLAGKGSAHGG